MAAAHEGWKAQADEEIARRTSTKPARKPAAAKVKRPGDIGWKPRSLAAIIKAAGNASWTWDAESAAVRGWNGMLAARQFGLRARGWMNASKDSEGYVTWQRGAERVILGPYGALYMGDGTWRQLPRDEREAITEAGRPGMAAAVAAPQLRQKRNEAEIKHRAARLDMIRFRALVRTGKTGMTEVGQRDAMRGKVAYAWKLRTEARAIVAGA
jgi:hypothetical protein